jgi:hypothetical protein
VPGHGEVDDGGLVNKENTFLKELQSRVIQLKVQGKSDWDNRMDRRRSPAIVVGIQLAFSGKAAVGVFGH